MSRFCIVYKSDDFPVDYFVAKYIENGIDIITKHDVHYREFMDLIDTMNEGK